MAYFPNGTSGLAYQERYCYGCKHFPHDDPDAPFCAVWTLHLLYNREAVGKNKDETAEAFLNTLIPRGEDGLPGECSMYLPDDSDAALERKGQGVLEGALEVQRNVIGAWIEAQTNDAQD